MNSNDIALSSLALDLKRIALGLHRKSFTMADRFTNEAILRTQDTDSSVLAPYMKIIMNKLAGVLVDTDTDRKAENALMYSTLIQNYVLKNTLKS